MQHEPAFVLVSCTLCRQLHEPLLVDAANPFCAPCAAVATRRPTLASETRPLAR